MLYLYVLVIILHIAFAAAWLGMSLRLPRLAKLVASSGEPVASVLAEEGRATVGGMDKYPVLIFGFGVAAILLGKGFAGIGWNFHVALSLGLVLILVQVFLIRRSWVSLQRAVGTPDVDAARRKVAMSVGIGHLTWFVLLVLMFVPRVLGV